MLLLSVKAHAMYFVKRIYLTAILTIISLHLPGKAIDSLAFDFKYIYGNIPKINTNLRNLVRDPVTGFELGVEKQTDGSQLWHHTLHFPHTGIGFNMQNLGFPDTLGYLYALYQYINFPIIDTRHFLLNFKTGIGAGYITKTFWETINYATANNGELYPNTLKSNMISGTPINLYFTLGLNYNLILNNHFAFLYAFRLSHTSNGNSTQPNKGINIINHIFGIRLSPEYKIKKLKATSIDLLPYSYSICMSGGRRELFFRDFKKYPIASIMISINKQINNTFRIGFGIDGFFDSAYGATRQFAVLLNKPFDSFSNRHFISKTKLENQIRIGFNTQPEVTLGRLKASIHTGVYLYDPVKNFAPFIEAKKSNLNKPIFYKYNILEEDGWFYTHFVIRYEITKKIFIHAGLKNHLSIAEFLDYGVGITL